MVNKDLSPEEQEKEFKELIDKTAKLNKQYTQDEKTLESWKKQIKEYASEHGYTSHAGFEFEFKINPRSETFIDPYKLFAALRKAGRGREFFNYVKIGVTIAKNALGEVFLAPISDKVNLPPSITFKALKKD